MPRGKNYVNQNTGMKLQGKEQVKELCFYGNACTRKDCIYRHDRTTKVIVGNLPKSYTDPCMAYLAGHCAFNDTTCRKYHPTTDEEITALLEKYQRIPCKFTIHCKTKGCLYKHVDPNAVVPMNHNMMNMMMNFNIHPPGNIPPTPTTMQYFPPLASSISSNTNHPNQSKINSNVLSDPNLFPPLSKSSLSSSTNTTTTTTSSSSLPPAQQQQHTGTSPSNNDYYCVPVTNNDSSSIYPNSSNSHTNHNNNNHSITNSASGTFASTPTTTRMNSTSSSSSILKPVVPIDYRIKHQNNTNNISYDTTTNYPNPNTTGTTVYNHGIPNQYPTNSSSKNSNNTSSSSRNNEMNVSTGPPSFNITAKEFIPGGTNRYPKHH